MKLFLGTKNRSFNKTMHPLLARCPHRACRMSFHTFHKQPSPSKVPRWAQQVLFLLKTARFEFAEPSMSRRPPDPASTLRSSVLFALETVVSSWPNLMIWWPTLQTANDLFSHGNRPFRNACQPLAIWLLEPSSRPKTPCLRAGQVLWLINDLKGRHSARSPNKGKLSAYSSTRCSTAELDTTITRVRRNRCSQSGNMISE